MVRRLLDGSTPLTALAQTFGTRIVTIVLQLTSGVITARSLGPTGRGEQSAIGLWPWLVVGVSTIGLPSAIRYYTSSDRKGKFLLSATIVASIASACGAFAGCGLIYLNMVHRYSAITVMDAQLMMVMVPVIALSFVFRGFCEAVGNFRQSNTSSLLSPMATVCLLVILVVTGHLTPLSANLALFGPIVFQTVSLGWRLRGEANWARSDLLRKAKQLSSYGLRSYGNDIMSILSLQADQALIISFLRPADLGIYTVALTAARTINIFQESVNVVLFPTASGLEKYAAIELVVRAARLNSLVSGLAVAFLFIVVPLVLPAFYGRAFAGAGSITCILLIEAYLRGVSSVLLQGFLALNRPGSMTIIQCFWFATSLGCLTVLIPRLGIIGAAIALVLSSSVRLVLIMCCYPLILKMPFPRVIPMKSDLRYITDRIVKAKMG